MRGRDACGACRENARKQCMQGVQGMCVKGMRAGYAGKMRKRNACGVCRENAHKRKVCGMCRECARNKSIYSVVYAESLWNNFRRNVREVSA